MGLATAFSPATWSTASYWDVDEAETLEPAATEEKWPKGEYFIMDVQTHFTNGAARSTSADSEFVKNMGFKLKNDAEAYGFPNFVKEMFFDSETSMVVISGVPGKENTRDDEGKVLEGPERTPGCAGKILPSWLMSARKKELNDLAGCQRALCQGNCAPNHYWDKNDQHAGPDRAVRADGARGQDLRHRLVEVVLPHRSGPLGQRLQARRREADLSVLRAVAKSSA